MRTQRPLLPSSSTPRLLTLLVTLLACALFAGNWVFTIVFGARWDQRVQLCLLTERTPAPDLAGAQARQASFQSCIGAVEAQRVAFAVGAMILVALAAGSLMMAAPFLLERRRRLRPPDQRFTAARARFGELAVEAGVRAPPTLMIGGLRQADAFSYGRPGAYRVAIPPALAIRPNSDIFASATRHELQHVAHHDIPLAWLARSLGTALAVLFGIPVVLSLADRDTSLLRSFAPRAAVLVIFVLLARAAWLRARELDADLAAAQLAGDTEPFRVALRATNDVTRADGSGPARHPARQLRDAVRSAARRWRHATATHPEPEVRVALLTDPARIRSARFSDGLVLAFSATFALPLIAQSLSPALAAHGAIGHLDLITALILGPLVGTSLGLGLGLWRQRVLAGTAVDSANDGDAVAPASRQAGEVAAGVLLGGLTGQVASFAVSGSGWTGLDHPVFLLVVAAALAGTALLTDGVAGLWARASRRLPGRLAWVPPAVVATLLFTHTFWWSVTLQKAFDWGGWALALSALVTLIVQPAAGIVVVVISVAAGWGLWLAGLAQFRRAVVTGCAVGVVGGLTIVTYRLVAGPAPLIQIQEQRYYTYLVMSAATAAAAGLIFVLQPDPLLKGAAPLVSALSAGMTQSIFVALNTLLGGDLTWDFTWRVVLPPVAASLPALTLFSSCALASLARPAHRPSRSAPRADPSAPSHRGPLSMTIALGLGAVVAIGIMIGRTSLLPFFELAGVTSRVTTEQTAQPWTVHLGPMHTEGLSPEAKAYVFVYAPFVDRQYVSYRKTLNSPGIPDDLRDLVRQTIDQVLVDAGHVRLASPQVQQVHRHVVAAFTHLRDGDIPHADAEYGEWRRTLFQLDAAGAH